ncbi:hypothetical protein EUX98_g8846 [Antrodiella citrinella]|uniref:Pheromone n=1 Tax=Antrodiella citrinella TaxID=2447956 RepID=A0A4S4M3F7_9APHY|nr:hypothetical protein EUX98_g8846 [Antrodiella citrinella]
MDSFTTIDFTESIFSASRTAEETPTDAPSAGAVPTNCDHESDKLGVYCVIA